MVATLFVAYFMGRALGYLKPIDFPDHIPHLATVARTLIVMIFFGIGLLTLAAPVGAGMVVAGWLIVQSLRRRISDRKAFLE